MTWRDALAQYCAHLAERSEQTARTTRKAVTRFFAWYGVDLEDLYPEDVAIWRDYCLDRTIARPTLSLGAPRMERSTAHHYVERLKRFLVFCAAQGWTPGLSTEAIVSASAAIKHQVVKPYEVLSDVEVTQLLEATADNLKARCVIVLALFAGLRSIEIERMTAGRVCRDEQGPYLQVFGKGNKEAALPIDESVYALLQQYISGMSPGQRLFPGNARRSNLYMLHAAADAAGITSHITMHGLRHTFAFRLLKAGVPLDRISKLLRHSTIAMTERYVNHLSREDVARYAPALPGRKEG